MQGIFWQAANWLASQQGLCSLEEVSKVVVVVIIVIIVVWLLFLWEGNYLEIVPIHRITKLTLFPCFLSQKEQFFNFLIRYCYYCLKVHSITCRRWVLLNYMCICRYILLLSAHLFYFGCHVFTNCIKT